jgi:hypothetical protein
VISAGGGATGIAGTSTASSGVATAATTAAAATAAMAASELPYYAPPQTMGFESASSQGPNFITNQVGGVGRGSEHLYGE